MEVTDNDDPYSDDDDAPDRPPSEVQAAVALACIGGSAGVASPGRSSGPKASAGGARLGLSFSGGPSNSGVTPLSWRDGRFSDWNVQVGTRNYQLHTFLLARASLFFQNHMSMPSQTEAGESVPMARHSDLTGVLPQSCHAAFEDTLDFMYSENQSGFEVPASKALLLLKIADILGIQALFQAMGQRIEAAFSETAPLLLEQYCRFHIPGTEDGEALWRVREEAVELIVQRFQSFLAIPDMHTALLHLPASVIVGILEHDELLVAGEDAVFDFLAARLEVQAVNRQGDELVDNSVDEEQLWLRVRWQYLSAAKFAQALELSKRLLRPGISLHALTTRLAQIDIGHAEAFASLPLQLAPVLHMRRPILPPGVPPPTSTDIDFCFHFARSDQFSCGEALRSQPKVIGDLVIRVLVFPGGTDTGVAKGSLSIFLEAVPQAHWPREWEFANIRYSMSIIRWPSGSGETWAAKRKTDLWTFRGNRLDRGWHDFLAPGEIHKFLGPNGFVCIRGGLEAECLPRTFLLNSNTVPMGSEVSGSSASRRS